MKRSLLALGAIALISAVAVVGIVVRGNSAPANAFDLTDPDGGLYPGIYHPPTSLSVVGPQPHDVVMCINTTGWDTSLIPYADISDVLGNWSNAAWDQHVEFIQDSACPHSVTPPHVTAKAGRRLRERTTTMLKRSTMLTRSRSSTTPARPGTGSPAIGSGPVSGEARFERPMLS